MLIHHHRVDAATDTAPARLSLGVSGIDYATPSATEHRGEFSVSWYGARELLTFNALSDARDALLPSSVGNHTSGAILGAYGASQAAEFYAPDARDSAADDYREADAEPLPWPGRFNALLGASLGAVYPVTVVGPSSAPRELFAPVVAVSAWLVQFAPRWCLVPSVVAATAGEIVFVLVPRDAAAVLAEMTPTIR